MKYIIQKKRLISTNQFHNFRWLPLDPNFMKFLWVPNIFVYNLDTFDAMFSLQKLSGLWIIEKQDIFYNQVNVFSLIYQLVNYTFLNWEKYTTHIQLHVINIYIGYACYPALSNAFQSLSVRLSYLQVHGW